jgi:hypothetical protein
MQILPVSPIHMAMPKAPATVCGTALPMRLLTEKVKEISEWRDSWEI